MMKDAALVSFLGVNVASASSSDGQRVGKADVKGLEAFVVTAFYWALTAVFTYFQRQRDPAGEGLRPHRRHPGRGKDLLDNPLAEMTTLMAVASVTRPAATSTSASGGWRMLKGIDMDLRARSW